MLIKCQECKRSISDTAPACPGCGAPVVATPKVAIRTIPRETTKAKTTFGCLILAGMGVAACVGLASLIGKNPEVRGVEPQATATISPEEAVRAKRGTAGAIAVASLKAALRDPDSLKVDRVLVTDDAKYTCVEYRAKNGFGGMNRDHVVFTKAGGDQSARGWNRHCVGSSGFHDVTREAVMLGE